MDNREYITTLYEIYKELLSEKKEITLNIITLKIILCKKLLIYIK